MKLKEQNYSYNKTIHQLFEEQAAKTPDNIAVVEKRVRKGCRFIDTSSGTYRELDRKANQVARVLRTRGVTADTIVAVMAERSVEMVVGILGILKAGGTYMPIDPQYPAERINYMLRESGAKVVLTQESFRPNKTDSIAETIDMEEPELYRGPHSKLEPLSDAADMAYIIYTSGSTGRPKGVAVEHRSAVNLLTALSDAYPLSPTDGYLLKTSFLFDVSVSELFGWFLGGGRLIILERDGEKDPQTIIDTIEAAGVTHINFVPAMFNAFTRHLDPQNIGKITGLKYIFLAGEALVPELVSRFRRLNTAVQLENLYGPTEGTVYASWYSLSDWNGIGSIPIGKALPNVKLYILGDDGHEKVIGETGELCIAGAGVARGYLNNPELTAENFNKSYKTYRTYISYKTGDLARRLPDGNIEFLGRIDFQVKIRGFRVELGEIENRLLKHETIREAVVTARVEKNNDRYLCAYIVGTGEFGKVLDNTELREYLSQTLPDYMVPSFFVTLDQLPLTGSGKVDRKSLPEPEVVTEAEYVAPRNQIEEKLVELWSGVLGIEKHRIGIDDNFFELGGHSLKGTDLTFGIHKTFNVRLQLSELFKRSVIRKLSAFIKEAAEYRCLPLERAESKDYYTLSSAQLRLYILHQLSPRSTVYNIPIFFEMEGTPDWQRLEGALKKLITRHESLRTSFQVINEAPVQKIHKEVEFDIEYYDLGNGVNERIQNSKFKIQNSFVRPFDLTRAPLMRVGIIETGEERHILMMDMHHIISDGLSIDVLVRELMQLYDLKSLPPLRAQYKDYSVWENREKSEEALKSQRGYWLKEFAGEIPGLSLPLDYTRPMAQSFEGNTLYVELEKNESEELYALANAENVTLYMLFFAAYYILLAKLSGQEDITLGTSLGGRKHVELHHAIGMFVITLALRNFPKGEKRFNGFLKEVKERTLIAFENQDYPFEELVEAVVKERDMSRNPLFDCMFGLENIEAGEYGTTGLKMKPCKYHNNVSKVDLTLTIEELEQDLTLRAEYCTKLFKQDTIERFIRYYKKILSSIQREPGKKISKIEIISDEEKREILEEFNDTRTDYPQDKTIHQLFEEQVEIVYDKIAVVGMEHRTWGMTSLTYGELNEKSNKLAARLIKKGVSSGNIVGIMVERSVEMVVGVLAILKAGGAYLPIEPDYPEERIQYILADSGANVLLTNLPESHHFNYQLSIVNYQLLMSSQKPPFHHSANQFIVHHSSNLAYIIYTSGSTGMPKGVAVEHHSAVNILFALFDAYPISPSDAYLLKTAFLFDVSVTELFGWFMGGSRLIILERNGEKDPQTIIDTIEEHHVTHINFVPAMFNAFVNYLDSCNINKIAGLKYIFLAGEALVPELVSRFRRYNTSIHLENLYGPTEGTVYASGYSLSLWNGTTSIPIGKPLPNIKLFIQDKEGHLKAIGETGELSIAGAGVARGYLNNPELTAEKFDQDFQDLHDCQDEKGLKKRTGKNFLTSLPLYPSTSLYRTGDLARWLPDGNVEFLGRIDFQVKIRGFRVELGEIENRLLKHETIKEAVVVVREEKKRDRYLCAYIVRKGEFDKTLGVTELREYLLQTLPDYMVPPFFVTLDQLPLTGSGKVERKSLPEPEVVTEAEYVVPRDEIEEKLAEMWSGVLGIEKHSIGIDDNFFQLGGHSLKATIFASRIHKEFDVQLIVSDIFRMPDIKRLSQYIKKAVKEIYIPIEKTEEKEYYSLSSAQERLYILNRMKLDGTGYNLSALHILDSAPDFLRLRKAFERLIERHESLRTSFHMIDDRPVQKIHKKVEFDIDYYDLGNQEKEIIQNSTFKILNSFIRPFDLSEAPLLRVGLIKKEDNEPILLMDMHHIIADGLSLDILKEELTLLYESKQIPLLKVQYKDCCEWQRREQKKEEIRAQEAYWLKTFEGEIPVLDLPNDFPRPSVQGFEGDTFYFELGSAEAEALINRVKQEGVTLFMMLLAIYTILLAKLSSQDDIVVGSPASGRHHVDMEPVIGMFVNTLALRTLPMDGKTFKEFLNEIKTVTLAAFENQEYQFEELVEKVAVNRDLSRNPLFDAMFVLENIETPGSAKQELTFLPFKHRYDQSKFDLTLFAKQSYKALSFTVEYSTRLFKEERIRRFVRYFKRIASRVIDKPEKRLLGIELISPEEKNEILYNFNDTVTEYPSEKTIHQLYEEQVEKTPDNIAIVGVRHAVSPDHNPVSITYGELNRKSGQLTSLLLEKGVQPDTIVGIMVERSFEMVVGILAILKAGGVYMPIDPDYPNERKRYILSDSNVGILITAHYLSEGIVFEKEMIYLENYKKLATSLESSRRAPCSMRHASLPGSSNLAYVIYTSGSTGQPKGVMVEHRQVINLVYGLDERIFNHYGKNLNVALVAPFIFDASVQQIFAALLMGHALHIVPNEDRIDGARLIEFYKNHKIEISDGTPTHLRLMAESIKYQDIIPGMKHFIIGGEALPQKVVESFLGPFGTYAPAITNIYGPTECCVDSTSYEITKETSGLLGIVPIGKPMPNEMVYILDSFGRVQPPGVVGELCIAGAGVARGYLNNPELTAEKFDQDFQDLQDYQDEKVLKKRRGKKFLTPLPLYPSTSLYRTGDLARWLPDGNIEFLGRIDLQVKIRGFRIELEEVENQLLKHHQIKEVVVVAREEEKGLKYLCAYIVFISDQELSVSRLRDYLAKQLPDYMIPEYFLPMEKIPLTPSGKVDRKRLPEPERYRPKLETDYIPPSTELEKIIGNIWKKVLKLENVGVYDRFFELGGNSMKFIQVNHKLQEYVGENKDIPVITMFQYPTIHSLARYLSGEEEDKEVFEPRFTPDAGSGESPDIAVIGMAGRFPGAKNIQEFWENLKNGAESITFFSDEELEEAGVSIKLLKDANYVKARGFLENTQYFDASFFNYTPKESDVMNPQLRLYHECTWTALEDAGYNPETYKGRIGVYAGAYPDISWISTTLKDTRTLSEHYDVSLLNNASGFGTRISYKLGLMGPSFSVQTACSTSLVAVHLACQGLLNHECDISLAGGVAISSPKKSGYLFQEGMILSSDGHNRTFDAEAKGTVPGDGIGVVVLKRLREAMTDRDHIYAVVKGTAINNDGTRKVGYTAPSIEGQAEVIQAAMKMAKVEPISITYLETHGTGTILGDPIEIEGLKLAFHTSKKQFCPIGSVKSNIGHLDTAAGIAGFIKTVLALNHGLIPPSLHYKKSNPKIDFENSPFYVNTELKEWKNENHPLRAGVSSFGIGGTNAHTVLEEAPVHGPGTRGQESGRNEHQLIILSARTAPALDKMRENLHSYLEKKRLNPANHCFNLADVSFTLQTGRKSFNYRGMTLCSTIDEAVEHLSETESGRFKTFSSPEKNRPVVFMFPGQGSQYVNMGLELYQKESRFRKEMDHCFDILKPLMDYDLKEILYPDEATKTPRHQNRGVSIGSPRRGVDQTEITQPVIFVFEYALAKLLMAWGITPCAMIGHSIGEYTAACLAKVFSLEDALNLAALRGKLMQQMPTGAMLSVPLPEQEVTSLLMLNEKLELFLAAVNGPSSCVVSGTQEAVDTFAKQLKKRGYENRSLHTSHAFHSKMMDPILEEFQEKVKQISFNKPQIPYLSNLSGQWITDEAVAEPGYWVNHLRHTVRFFDGLTELLKKEEKAVLAEVGPGRVLSTFTRQHPDKTPNQLTLNLVRHPKESTSDVQYLLSKIGNLWLYGKEIDWEAFYSGETRNRVSLPSYPFERHPYRISGEAFSIVGAKTPPEDIQLNKKTDITDWFYTPSWKRVRLPLYEKKQMPGQTIWLLFTHEHALGKRLEEQMKKEDQEVIVVKQGKTFAKKDEREFTLNPRQEGDYDALFETLHSMERFPQRILHLWGLAAPSTSVENQPLDINRVEQELDTGFYSLLNIAKVVGKLNIRDEFKIDVVTDNMQEVTGDEQLCPAKAAVLGPVKIIPLEYPNIQCRSIDIVFSHKQRLQEEEILTQLLSELSREAPSPSVVVAFRRRHRWVQDIQPIRLDKHPEPIPRLKPGGVYLITGGLGGMGLVLARFLADRVKAKLVLTSRSDFPAPEAWDQWLDKHPGNDKISEKIRKIQELEKAGADVWVAKGDVANREEMKGLMEKIKERFGPLNGVIHSAGVPDGRLIHLRTREFTESILAPKVRGTLVLDSLVHSHHHYPLDFFVLCSSLNSIIGEIGQVGYTAANCFLDAYASHRTLSGGSFTVSINWDAWQETGMAKEARENRIIRDPNQETIISRLSPKNQWVIGEHRVNGTATLVGTAYLEMVNTAFERHAKGQTVEIRDFYYLAPLTVEEDEEKDVCIILEKEDAQWKFSLISRLNSDENQWQVHARGKLAAVESEPTRTLSIKNIREKCRVHQQDQQETSLHTFRPGAQSQLIAVGRRWDSLKKVWYGENQGLALVELASEFLEDIESHKLHPALLDSATAFLIDSLHSQEAYLPFSYKRVKIMGPLPAKVFSYARFVEKDPSQKQVLEFNIIIMDETGKELIDIEGLTVLAISKEKKKSPVQSEWVTPELVPAPTESVKRNPLKDAILSHEGVEVFERVLYDTLPQVVVSTVDFPLRLEKVKDRPTPGLAESTDEESAARPSHPRPELSTPYVAPKTGSQKDLASIWQEYLGIQEIGIHDDFFELGADSLKALTVIARIHKKLNVEVSITEIFNSPTIAALAEHIEEAGKSIYTSITPVEEKEYYPLSSAQTRLYLLQQLQRESVFYNLPFVCIVEGPLDISRLEEALQALIQRHESLRTSFELIDDDPVQKIHRTVDFKVKYHGSERKANSANLEETLHAPCAVRHSSTIKHFVRPFDLAHVPLMRMEVVKIGKEKYLWLFDIHHIITDATGYAVLQKDLVKLYDRKKLHALRIQYKDFSAWQNRLIRSQEIKEQEKYWLNVYSDSGEIPRLNMPTDFPRPKKLRFEGGRFYFKLGTEDTQKFKELGSHAGATLFANLLSILNVLLFKYTGQNDIIVGGSIAGRPHADLQDIVGMFVNMLPIRIHPDQEMTYWDLLEQVKTTSLNAFENQDMQFEMLVEQLKPRAETSRNPLFDICLNVQNYEQPEIEIKGLTMTPCPYEPDTSKFDMLVWANPVGDDIHFMLEYSTELFKPSSVEEFSKHFIEIIQQVIKNKEISLKDIKVSQKLLMPESDVPEIDFGF